MLDISICIVSYQTRDLLRDALASIYGQPTQASFEVIVVDNASQDGTQEMLEAEFPQVRLVKNDHNTGYTAPMNQALRLGGGRYLVQLNPDTKVLPGAFDVLTAYMDSHPRVGICTPKVLNRDGTLQRQCRRSAARPWDVLTYFSGLAARYPHDRRFGGYLQTFLPEDEINPVEAVSGSCMFIRREVTAQIGYLDEVYFAYQEDADFCFRARKAGWEVMYNPQAQIIHYGGEGGSRNQPYHAIYQWHRSYFIYYRKNLASDYFFLFNGLYYLMMLAKLLLTLLVTVFRREKIVGSRKP